MSAALLLFPLSAGIGLSLYACLAAAGLAAHLGWVALPGDFTGLASPTVWGTLLGLLAIEIATVAYRLTDLVWTVLHTVTRPLAAALLASLALATSSLGGRWGGALAAAVVALLVHLSVMGIRVAAWTPAPLPRPWATTALQTLAAASLGWLAFARPEAGAALAAVVVLAPLPWAPGLGALAYSALRATVAALWQPGRRRQRWDAGAERLPTALRRAVEVHLGRRLEAVRSARVTLLRHGAGWPFQRGRLIIAPEAPALFAQRRLLQAEATVVELEAGEGRAGAEFLLQLLEVRAGTPYVLCIGPEAPPGPAILAVLTGEEGVARGEPAGPAG